MKASRKQLHAAKSQLKILHDRLETEEKQLKVSRRMSMKEKQLLKITKNVTSSFKLESLFENVMHHSCELLDADRSALFLIDSDKDEMYSKAANDSKQIRIPRTASLCGFVATTGEHILLDNAYDDPRFNPSSDLKTGYKTKSVLCVAVKDQETDSILGCLEVINKRNNKVFTKDDLGLLEVLCDHISVAVKNCQKSEISASEIFCNISSQCAVS